MSSADTPWARGRLDGRAGPRRVLFGRMYEDPAIELAAFAPGSRVFCIASAGCTAMALSARHEVVAVDINPAQLDYAARRLAGEPAVAGTAERIMGFARAFGPLAGWTRGRIATFLAMDDTALQQAFWRGQLETRRFRLGFDALLSLGSLRAVYSPELLAFLPPRLGAVMRARLARCFARHPNRSNPWAAALLAGELPEPVAGAQPANIRLVHADAAAYLESVPCGSFAGFAISNILDGVGESYRARLAAAMRRAAAPGAVVVDRSFREPAAAGGEGLATDDRAMLWGVVGCTGVEDFH